MVMTKDDDTGLQITGFFLLVQMFCIFFCFVYKMCIHIFCYHIFSNFLTKENISTCIINISLSCNFLCLRCCRKIKQPAEKSSYTEYLLTQHEQDD